MYKAWLFLLTFNLFLFAQSKKEDWESMQKSETLELLMNGRPAGVSHSTLSVKDSGVEIVNKLEIGTSVVERRVYGFDGALIYAEQAMSSPSGENSWELLNDAGKWTLAVTAGGVRREKSVSPVKESIRSLYELYGGIMNSTLKSGISWDDSAFELTSGEYVLTTTVCREIPAGDNGYNWVFTSRNNIVGKDEIWRLDSNGNTVYRESYPFTARAVASSNKRDSIEPEELFETFKIAADRKPAASEKLILTLDSLSGLDSSVLSYYQKTPEGYLLKAMKQKVSGHSMSWKLPDSLLDYTLPTSTVQSDHPDIIRLSESVRKNIKGSVALVKAYNDWVYRKIEKRNVATFSSAVETLKAGFGDCGEHAVLLAALLRAAGIPARVVMGLVYMESGKGYYYHAWVSAFAGEWVFADPSHGLFPANFGRIPLVLDDSGEKMVQLARLIGRVRIGVVK